jgi:hypothetical protein
MKRRLFHAAALMSLVLCVALSGLWVRSYWRIDFVRDIAFGRCFWFSSRSGRWMFSVDRIGPETGPQVVAILRRTWRVSVVQDPWEPRFLWEFKGGWGSESLHLVAPHWALVLPFTVIPAAWAAQRIRAARRRASSACPACGYDLRGTPASNPCPECGFRGAATSAPESAKA